MCYKYICKVCNNSFKLNIKEELRNIPIISHCKKCGGEVYKVHAEDETLLY